MLELSSAGLAKVTRLLDESGVSWGIFGGAAAKIFGAKRPLQDIDILIPCDSGQPVSKLFPDANLDIDAEGRVAALELPGYDIIAGLFQNIHFCMDTEMAIRTNRYKLLGVDLPVLSIEDNIAFKALMGRGPEVGKHDWEDAASMIKNASILDWNYLQWRLQNCEPKKAQRLVGKLRSLAGFSL